MISDGQNLLCGFPVCKLDKSIRSLFFKNRQADMATKCFLQTLESSLKHLKKSGFIVIHKNHNRQMITSMYSDS